MQTSDIDLIHSIFNVEQTTVGMDYIHQLTKNIGLALNMKYILIGRPSPECKTTIKTDSLWTGEDYGENFEYDLKGTPCLNVISGKRVCIHTSNVTKEFPEDLLLEQMEIDGYAGAPIITPEGELIGLLVALDNKRIESPKLVQSVLEIAAGRLGSEYSRMLLEEKFRNLNKELEEKLEKRSRELSKAKEKIALHEKMSSMTTLTTGLAHELKNPHHLIVNSVEILKGIIEQEVNQNLDDADECINIIKESTNRSITIIDSLIHRKDIDSEKKVQLSHLLRELKKYFLSIYPETKINLQLTSLADEIFLPQLAFHRVMNNILLNSQQAIETRKIKGFIDIHLIQNSNQNTLHINDNGCGMNAAALKKVFEPFFTTKTDKGCVGLGMYIVFDILSSMRSSIEIESVVDDGTQVKINLSNLEKLS
jgi:signal transduction histidine kinase